MKTRSSKACGFTLLEVLVALLILSLSLLAAAETMGRMLTNAHLMRERTFASWIAQNVIVQMRAEGAIPEPGTDDGEVEFAHGVWTWRSEVSETGVENLMRVDVSVSHPGEEHDIKTVTGFVGVPSPPNIANNLWLQRRQGDDESGEEAFE